MTSENLTRDFLITRLDNEYYAIDVAEVAEVLPFIKPTRVPHSPKFLSGLIDVRGNLLPVIDMRLRAQLPAMKRPRHIIALRLSSRFIGAIVDEVCDVLTIDEAVSDEMDVPDQIAPQFVSRAVKWSNRVVPVLNLQTLFTSEEALRLKEIKLSEIESEELS
jgi:purine-binding chemotaxis protein CheW